MKHDYDHDSEVQCLYEEIASLNNEIADLHEELCTLMGQLDVAKQDIASLEAELQYEKGE